MTYYKFDPKLLCPKCGFPFLQMRRHFFNKSHKIENDKIIEYCKLSFEHIHVECLCGYECICKPMDYKK